MDSFSGNLSDYRLQLVVPALFDGRPATGELTVARGSIARSFVLARGFLVSARSNLPREHLPQVLVELKILDLAQAAAAFEAARGASVSFGSFLVDRGFVDSGRVLEALCHKAREAWFDCYGWESGEVAFTPGDGHIDPGIDLRLPLGTLHRDALARQREWALFKTIFPDADTTFQVYREWAAVWGTPEEESIVGLAERGASLAEILASDPEGPLATARRLLLLYRRGVMTPRPRSEARMGEAAGIEHLLTLARAFLARGSFESAAAVCAQALERGPVPEAQTLYREAEQKLGVVLSEQVLLLEGRLLFEPIPRPAPSTLTADDLYLYGRLKASRSIRQALRTAAMGEFAAYQCLQRLVTCGAIRLAPITSPPARCKTDPYGMPVVLA